MGGMTFWRQSEAEEIQETSFLLLKQRRNKREIREGGQGRLKYLSICKNGKNFFEQRRIVLLDSPNYAFAELRSTSQERKIGPLLREEYMLYAASKLKQQIAFQLSSWTNSCCNWLVSVGTGIHNIQEKLRREKMPNWI